MLIGPTAGGKTTIRKILRRSLIINAGGTRTENEDMKDGDAQKVVSKFLNNIVLYIIR